MPILEPLMIEGFDKLIEKHSPPLKPLPTNPWEFCQQCVWTIDEASAWNTEQVIRKFPDWDYLHDVIEFMHQTRYGRIDKSGQLLVSWAVIAYRLWCFLTKRGFRYAYYCGTQTKAEGHLKNRFWRLYQNIPSEYAKPHATFVNGQMLCYHDGPEKLPTAYIIPQAAEQRVIDSAAEKMRSETWTAADLDESAFYPNLQELHNGLLPRTQDLHHISTPNGENFFHLLGFGDIHDEGAQRLRFETIEKHELRRGVWQWTRNGFEHLRVIFEAHPDRRSDTEKGLEWQEQMRLRMGKREFSREQECSYDVAAGRPVFDQTEIVLNDRQEPVSGLIVKPQSWKSQLACFRSLDAGFLWPFCYAHQVEPVYNEAGQLVKEQWHTLREFVRPNTYAFEFGQFILAECDQFFPGVKFVDYGDDATKQRTDKGSTAQILQSLNIIIISQPTGTGGIIKGCEVIQQKILHAEWEIDPQCVYLIAALRHGYVRDDEGKPVTTECHPHRDAVDACRYFAQNFFGFTSKPDGHSKIHRPVGARPPGEPVKKSGEVYTDPPRETESRPGGKRIYRPKPVGH